MQTTPEEIQALKAIIKSKDIEIKRLKTQNNIFLDDLKLLRHMRREALKSITLLAAALKKATKLIKPSTKITSEEFIKGGENEND